MQERRDPWRHDLRISRRACSRRDDEDEPGQRITICRNAPTGVKRGVGLGGGRIDHRTKQVVEWTIQKRRYLQDLYIEGQILLSPSYLEQQNYAEAISACREI